MKQLVIPATIVILSLLSILTLSSIAPTFAPRQLIFFIIGFVVFFSVSKISFSHFEKLGVLAYVLTNALLVITLILAPVTKGSTRWIDIGGVFSIQPSQLAIPATALFLIYLFKNKPLTELKNIFLFLFWNILPALLIFMEPDLGTTLVFLASTFVILYMSKTKFSHITLLVSLGIVFVALTWIFFLKPYQKERITSFIQPHDTQGTSYNARQSLIAVGSGGFIGRGLGQGVQSHLRFLPERQTDFIFASFTEEFGFVGATVVLSLYLILITTVLRTAQETKNNGEKLFCYVTACMTILQSSVNIGMNIGLIPITGITLPFMSYGGSSILTLLGMYGIIQSIRINQKMKVTLHLS